jgi:hypothetical protein
MNLASIGHGSYTYTKTCRTCLLSLSTLTVTEEVRYSYLLSYFTYYPNVVLCLLEVFEAKLEILCEGGSGPVG